MATDAEARERLLRILDDAKTFEDVAGGITAEHGAPGSHALFGFAERFITEQDPSKLDSGVQERFAQVLSRMVDSKEALHLAAVLERPR